MTKPEALPELLALAEAIDRAERLIGNIETFGPQMVARGHIRTLKPLIEAALKAKDHSGGGE